MTLHFKDQSREIVLQVSLCLEQIRYRDNSKPEVVFSRHAHMCYPELLTLLSYAGRLTKADIKMGDANYSMKYIMKH